MTEKQLKRAREIESEIWNAERDIQDISKILLDYNGFGSDISFKRNSDGFSRSFGSKKYDFKLALAPILSNIQLELQLNLTALQEEFKKL